MKDTEMRRREPPSLAQFKEFVRKIISVPKAEIDKAETRYQQKRKSEKRKS